MIVTNVMFNQALHEINEAFERQAADIKQLREQIAELQKPDVKKAVKKT